MVVANGGNDFSKGDLIMRKVLLATTALVAMNVTAAQAFDLSIGGNYEFEYTTDDAGDAASSDGQISFTASKTAENGVTWSWNGDMKNDDGTGFEGSYIKASSDDMGTLYLGDVDDDALTLMDGALGINNDIESQNTPTGVSTVTSNGNSEVNYISPSIAGLKLGVAMDVDNGKTGYAINYSMAGVSLYYGGTETGSSVGAKGSLAGFTIAAGSRSVDNSSEKSSDIALKYTLDNGITLAGVSARGTTSLGAKVKYSNIGASYAITDGVAAKVESGDDDGNGYTWASVHVTF